MLTGIKRHNILHFSFMALSLFIRASHIGVNTDVIKKNLKLSRVFWTQKEKGQTAGSPKAALLHLCVKRNHTNPQHRDKSSGNYFLILGVIDCPPDLLEWTGG